MGSKPKTKKKSEPRATKSLGLLPDVPMENPIKVLAIDGGGVRGIIPAMVLAEIENRTQKHIADLFDLFAGTSTGAILALGLLKPNRLGRPQYSAERLAQLYEIESPRIFHRPLLHTLHSVGGILTEKYPADGLERVMKRYFGEVRLEEALKEILITSYDIERRKPYFFKKKKAIHSPEDDFSMREVIRATCAAPTFFEPAKITRRGRLRYRALVDGCVYATNPSLLALVEAMVTYPKTNDIVVVSLGSGTHTRKLAYEDAVRWGLAQWAPSILSMMFDGGSYVVDHQMKYLLPTARDGSPRYYRFQTELKRARDEMDDTSPENIRFLKTLGKRIIKKENSNLKRLCAMLTKNSA
ncbi:MAG: patatin-like phospholipase family protein [Acidobacteria bacterium]|nr:patatin-like phospholipase family protein [Acidobacteriota bacterium]